MSEKNLTVGIDLGNKQTKIYIPKQEGIKNPIFKVLPSSLLASEAVGDNIVGSLINRENSPVNRVFQLVNENSEYIWGENLNIYKAEDSILQSISNSNRYEMREYMLLSKFALAESVKMSGFTEDAEKINVIANVGLPDVDYNELQISDFKSIKDIYKGFQGVVVDGETVQFNVTGLYVTKQGLGTPFNVLVDEDGNIQHEELLGNRSMWVDLGGGTVILSSLVNFRPDPVHSDVVWTGADETYRHIRELVAQKQGVKLDINILEQNIKQGQKTYKLSRTRTIDFSSEYVEAKKKSLESIKNTILRTAVDMSQVDELFFTGGGANLYNEKDLLNMFDFGEVVSNAEFSNVVGFVKAQQVGE